MTLAAILGACRGREPSERSEPPAVASQATGEPSASASPLPSFEVTSDEVSKTGMKRTVLVTLPHRIDAPALTAIANQLKVARSAPVERTFMLYSLAGVTLTGAWATTHFNPEIEVKILGLSASDFDRLKALRVTKPGRSEVGAWIDEDLRCLVSIHREGSLTILRRDFLDGSNGESPVAVTRTGKQVRLDDIPKSEHGEFYSFAGGRLQYVGPQGIFRTLNPRAPVDIELLR